MNKTSSIARGGIYTTLTILLLYLSSILPTSKLTVLAAASAIIPLSILTIKVKSSLLVYAASGVLALLLGLRGAAITYILFFGLFGFVKYYTERIRKMPVEILLKLLFCNLSIYIIYSLYSLAFVGISLDRFPLPLMLLGLQVAFIIFDYALTLIISYINKKFV